MIIKIIRSNYDDEQIKKEFTEKFGLSELQGQAILDMQLKRLSGLQIEKLDDEYEELLKTIEGLREILDHEEVLLQLIKDELLEIKDRFDNERRTVIKPDLGEIDIEDLIEEEEVLITLTRDGYIKRLPADTYKVQNRGGKGVMGLTTKEDDFVENLFITSTHDNILFFTNFGRVYSKKAYEIQEGRRAAKGQAIINILQLESDERVTAVFPIKEIDEDNYIVLLTKNGTIKRTEASMFENIRTTGVRAITLVDDDELVAAKYTKEDTEILIVTEKGQSIRFDLRDVRPMGRSAQGVIGIRLNPDDNVISMGLVDENKYVLVVSEFGYGKKTLLTNYKVQNRGGKGLKTYKITKKTGRVAASQLVNMEDEIILVSAKGDVIRLKVRDVSTQGRDTQGVKLKDVKADDDKIVAMTKYIEDID